MANLLLDRLKPVALVKITNRFICLDDFNPAKQTIVLFSDTSPCRISNLSWL